MLSLEKCKDILEQNGGNYSTEEVKKIRDFLYGFANFETQELQRKKQVDESSNIQPGKGNISGSTIQL